jgi:hypothetical protein
MRKDDREFCREVEAAGGVLVRQTNHLVYRLPNGKTFTFGATPSDRRAVMNNRAKLRRLLRETA